MTDPFAYNGARLVGIGGLLRSGKDTVADHLVEKFGWVKMGMSEPLNDALVALDPYVRLGINRDGESDRPEMERYSRVLAQVGYTKAKENLEVRRLLQALGTEVGRNMIGENTWADIAGRNAQEHLQAGRSVIVTGIRFPNEVSMIESLNGALWWVDRPGLDTSSHTGAHASENSVDETNFQVVIDNDSTLEALYTQVDRLLGE